MVYSPMRIGGLASGMDIDQIVSDLMKAERMRVDKLYQQKQVMEWQKADYRNINLKLRNLYNTTFDMKLNSSYLKYKTVGSMSDGSTYDKYFAASPGSGAIPGEYTLKVEQIASYAKLQSSDSITKPLTGQPLSTPLTIDGTNNQLDVTIDGIKKAITLTEGTYDGSEGHTITDLINDIQTQLQNAFGSEKIQITIKGDKLIFQPKDNYQKFSIVLEGRNALTALGFPDSDMAKYEPLKLNSAIKDQWHYLSENPLNAENKLSFKVNGKQFTFDFNENPDYSLNDILQKISADEDAGVKAYYDSLTDKVVIISKQTGAAANITVEDLEGSRFFEAMGFSGENTSKQGQDARIVLNGTIVEKPTNDFTVGGISFNLKEIMSISQLATFRVENDSDAAVESIKKYIDLYNETIDEINKKLSEERYRKFPPLTDAQRKDMSEKDIQLWEEKAKSGLLKSDPLLSRMINELRFAVNTPVNGLPKDMNNLAAIGITTGDWREQGKLHVNEQKLREAIVKDSDTVMRLFNASSEDFSSKGVANRMYDILKGGVADITEKAGGGEFQKFDNSILGKQIREMDERITSFEESLLRTEERYWRKFTEMEKAIQYMNQQSMWLTSQMNMYSGQ